MTAARRAPRVRRAVLAFAVLAVVYGIAAHAGREVLPRRVWMSVHYLENVELVPTYGSLAEEAVFLVRAGILQNGIVVSGLRVLGGLALGALVGVPLGLAMAWAPAVGSFLEPWVALFRFTPALALLPLYVTWFGLGETSRILLIATGVAVVMLHGAFEGVRGVPRIYLDAARAFGASRGTVFRRVVLPAALPHVVASLRIATGLAWITIVVAELVRPTMPSLGYLLALSGGYAHVPAMVVTIATIGGLVLVSDTAAVFGYLRATRWMRRRDG